MQCRIGSCPKQISICCHLWAVESCVLLMKVWTYVGFFCIWRVFFCWLFQFLLFQKFEYDFSANWIIKDEVVLMNFKILNLLRISSNRNFSYYVLILFCANESINCIYCNTLTQQEFLMLILLNKWNLQVLFL